MPAGAGTAEYGTFCAAQNVATLAGQKVDSYFKLDLIYRVGLMDNVNMTLAISNLTDEDPSFARSQISYDSGYGSPLGRTIEPGASVKFQARRRSRPVRAGRSCAASLQVPTILLSTRTACTLSTPARPHSDQPHSNQSHSSQGESFDLLIIGGGINGVGIARDAVGRGLTVALVEQADLASATSSSSTKLIHGGLRYLEFFEFRLVREALIERERLLGIAPHIIRPMRFVLPHVAHLRPRWQIRIGLFLYDHIGGRKRLPASRGIRLAGTHDGAALKSTITHGFDYSDCWVDDARLVILNAIDARERGARIETRTRAVGATPEGRLWRVSCESLHDGRRFTLTARAIVNAAGPWLEDVLRRVPRAHEDSQVRLVKGSHIVTKALYAGDHAFLLQNRDGRVVFTIPYERGHTLIGTTDVPFEDDPATVTISPAEIDYLCATVNGYFRASIGPGDVVWTYSGVRPLLEDESASASKVTRDYRLEFAEVADGPALLSIFGGKITTYRRLAEAALDKLRPYVGGSTHCWTDRSPLPGGELPRGDFEAFLFGVQRRWNFLPEPLARRLAHAYGTRIERVLGNARCLEDLGEAFGAGLTNAEVDYLEAEEWARTADDVLWRRSKLGLHLSAAERAALEQRFVPKRLAVGG